MSKTTIEKFKALQREEFELFKRKNKDYGDNFREDGMVGVVIRIKDKLSRFINLVRKSGESAVKEESLRDTLFDNGIYSKLAIIAHEDGQGWEPKDPSDPIAPPVITGGM